MTPPSATGGAPVGPYPAGPAPELRFTERMAGFVSRVSLDRLSGSTTGTERFEAGWAQGRDDGRAIEFVLTIRVGDLDALLASPDTPARATGTVVAPALSSHALTVTQGTFKLRVHNPKYVETWNMIYDLELVSTAGEQFHLRGFKILHERAGFTAWRDTTTLFVTVTSDSSQEKLFGIMRLTPGDLARQVRTMRVLHVPSRKRRIEYLSAFLQRFAHSLLRIYGGPLDEAARFPRLPAPGTWVPPTLDRLSSPLAPELYWLDASKQWHRGTQPGVDARLCLTRYKGGPKGPVILAPGFGMAASSFLTTTIDENLVEFLAKRNYDVWLFDYRASIHLQRAATSRFTLDDIARQDWPEGVAEVRHLLKAERGSDVEVQVVAHCVGSVTFLMALMAGMKGVHSAVCSQFTTQPMTSWFNLLKAHLRLSRLLQVVGARYIQPPVRRGPASYALDLALRAVPMAREERCGLAVCRWINAVYGLTHHHAQLNDATHKALIGAFGVGELDAFDHIAVIMRNHRALDHRGRDTYLPYPGRLNLPLHFLIGRYNYIFFPPGNFATIRWLTDNNGRSNYTYSYLPEYAHLDGMIGRDAAHDVYPKILAHLNQHQPPAPAPPVTASGSPLTSGPAPPTP